MDWLDAAKQLSLSLFCLWEGLERAPTYIGGEMTKTTPLDLAKEAYELILSIQPSFTSFPPTEEEEAKEHDRVYWARVNAIREILDA